MELYKLLIILILLNFAIGLPTAFVADQNINDWATGNAFIQKSNEMTRKGLVTLTGEEMITEMPEQLAEDISIIGGVLLVGKIVWNILVIGMFGTLLAIASTFTSMLTSNNTFIILGWFFLTTFSTLLYGLLGLKIFAWLRGKGDQN